MSDAPKTSAPASPSAPPPASGGERIKGGRYTLVRRLGEGAQGETFEAIVEPVTSGANGSAGLADAWEAYVARAKGRAAEPPAADGQRVAIKRFRVARAKRWKDIELAEREAETLAALDHPALPRYVEHFEEGGALYLVMEMMDGESLAAMRARRARFDVADVTRMLEDLAAALRYLHEQAPPIVHRDIKPANVVRRPDGRFALVDFGSVRDRLKPSGGSTVVGTFGYMAPEQFQGRALPSSDVYGVGATALAMLTGQEPEELPHTGLAIDVARAVPRRTPKGLVRALASMLEPDPDRRAASVEEALARLEGARGGGRATPPKRKTRKTRRRDGKAPEESRKEAARARTKRPRRRAAARRPPFLLRAGAKLGLTVAFVVVGVVVGLLVPLLLVMLSIAFGSGLRRAAGATTRAAGRANAALHRAWTRVSGELPDEAAEVPGLEAAPPRVRVTEAADGRADAHVRIDAEASSDELEGEALDEAPIGRARRRKSAR